MLNLCQVSGPLCSLVVEILAFINNFAPLCSLKSLVVDILVFLNKFAPLFSLWCLVGPPKNILTVNKCDQSTVKMR